MNPINSYDLEIQPCTDISQNDNLKRLELSHSQQMYVSALFQQLPSILASETMASAYMMKLPAGVSPSDLMQYTKYRGAVGNTYMDANNKIAGQAPLYSLKNQAIVMGVFSAMSIVTGQYYLSEINSNLSAINQKTDKILEFLYGDKKAELMAEVKFINFAYKNYRSVMENEAQRIATIVNIQEARKVAMKDVEFYVSDLDSLTRKKDISDLNSFVNDVFRIKDCLQLAIQLYGMSSILEVYYSQNTNNTYLKYLEEDIFSCIDKCEKRMLSDFSAVQTRINNYKGLPLKKIDKAEFETKIGNIVDLLGSGEELIKRKSLKSVLHAYQKESIYCLDKEGNVYLKTAS